MEMINGKMVNPVANNGSSISGTIRDLDFMRVTVYSDDEADVLRACNTATTKLISGIMQATDTFTMIGSMFAESGITRKSILGYDGDAVVNVPANILKENPASLIDKLSVFVATEINTVLKLTAVPADDTNDSCFLSSLNKLFSGIGSTKMEDVITHVYGETGALKLTDIADRDELFKSNEAGIAIIKSKLICIANSINILQLQSASAEVAKTPDLVSYQLCAIKNIAAVINIVIELIAMRQRVILAILGIMQNK